MAAYGDEGVEPDQKQNVINNDIKQDDQNWDINNNFSDGAIFLCDAGTIDEVRRRKLCGQMANNPMNDKNLKIVETLKRHSPLFLYNTTTRQLFGLFESVDKGRLDIKKEAWNGKYRAQIEFRIVFEFEPINKNDFDHIFHNGLVRFGRINKNQIKQLLDIFIRRQPKRNSISLSAVVQWKQTIDHAAASALQNNQQQQPGLNERNQNNLRPNSNYSGYNDYPRNYPNHGYSQHRNRYRRRDYQRSSDRKRRY